MASSALKIYQALEGLGVGQGITMERLTTVARTDEQGVRSSLTQIRHGRVRHPSGGRLPALPVYYERKSGMYYRADRLDDATVTAGVPQNIYSQNLTYVLSRVASMRESFVPGVQRSIEDQLISDPMVAQLLHTMDERTLTELMSDSLTLLKAYSRLRQEQLARLVAVNSNAAQLSTGD
jgi:hypothetical protein